MVQARRGTVVSPGTALSDAMLDQQRNNFLVDSVHIPIRSGLQCRSIYRRLHSDEVTPADLADELASLAPAELLVGDNTDEAFIRNASEDAAASNAQPRRGLALRIRQRLRNPHVSSKFSLLKASVAKICPPLSALAVR